MKTLHIKEMIYTVFSDFPEEDRKKIQVEFQKTNKWPNTQAWCFLSYGKYSCTAFCCKEDEFDEQTGAFLALSKLRACIINDKHKKYLREKKRLPWVPKPMGEYWTVGTDSNNQYIVKKRIWFEEKGGKTNAIDLQNGVVFRTEREARKHIKQKIQKGRELINKCKRQTI